ncbi:hypothetical protein FOA52_006254 [Chlamydomonas sp. UWO 241]|nr:hypothetical protein FOA52_006254 [Chlamydomonas sp. UWO 241]
MDAPHVAFLTMQPTANQMSAYYEATIACTEQQADLLTRAIHAVGSCLELQLGGAGAGLIAYAVPLPAGAACAEALHLFEVSPADAQQWTAAKLAKWILHAHTAMGCEGDPPRLVYTMGLAPPFRPGDSPVVGCWSADGVPSPSPPPFTRALRRRLFLVAAYGGHDLVRRLAGAPEVCVRQKLEDGTAAPVRRLRVTRVRAAVHRSPAAPAPAPAAGPGAGAGGSAGGGPRTYAAATQGGGIASAWRSNAAASADDTPPPSRPPSPGGDVGGEPTGGGTASRPASPGGSSYGAGAGDGDDSLDGDGDGADNDMPQAPAAGKRSRSRGGSDYSSQDGGGEAGGAAGNMAAAAAAATAAAAAVALAALQGGTPRVAMELYRPPHQQRHGSGAPAAAPAAAPASAGGTSEPHKWHAVAVGRSAPLMYFGAYKMPGGVYDNTTGFSENVYKAHGNNRAAALQYLRERGHPDLPDNFAAGPGVGAAAPPPLAAPPPAMSADRGRPGGRHAGGLRIATHNVRGLRGSTAQLVQLWLAVLRLDVVLIQETNLARRDSVLGVVARLARLELAALLAAEDADRPPLRFFWAHGPTPQHGVAIAIRSDLIDSGRLKVVGHPSAVVDGRLLSLKVEWRGHSLTLASAYLPSGDDKGQRAFITERIAPLAAGARGRLVMGGDFNFTPDPRGLDRRRRAGGAHLSRASECVTASMMADVCRAGDLVDVFRARHPHRRAFTYYSAAGNAAASRLDRFYAPEALLPHVLQCQAEVSPPSCSDHRPLMLHLSPAAPEKVGPGLRRLRVRFLDDHALRQEFAVWLEAEEDVAPAANANLLDWWPGFKLRLTREAARLSTMRAARAAAAAAELRDAMDVGARARGAAEPAALAWVLAASAAHSAALHSTALLAEQRARYMWLRDGERPSPLLSKLMRPPKASRQVGALRARGGGLTTDGHAMASTMARFFAGISTALPPDPPALNAVLAAVRSQASIQPGLAAAAGAPSASVAEVRRSLRQSRPGAAPGPDGIPIGLWRRGGAALPRLLARVYSAVGHTGGVPRGFLAGDVAPIFKKGDPAEPTNYRPITLLSTDYRMMTKTLAARLAPVLATVVGPHQTAFLPGRLITDNVLFMHLLPHLLASNRAAGDGDTAVVAAFLDFSKAYDTVSRPFLYAVMKAMGAGDGLLRWTRAILTGTTASATVNGFTSAAQPYHAGVRQGCPVAPALFLFAAEAQVRHLHDCPSVGIDIARGVRVFYVQYADDTLPLLRQLTPACVQAFLAFMHVFQMASRLALNPPKSQLLALGDAVPPDGVLPESVCGLAVVTEAASLGVVVEAGGEPQPDWEELLDQVALKYDKLARLPLSAFGRASASAVYGVGRLLHRATMHAVPLWVFDRLHRISKRLVDAGPTLPVALPTAEEAAAARAVAACVGWRSGPKTGQEPGRVIPLVGPGGLSVRDATGLQLQGFEGTRRACHTDYVTAALLLSGTPALAASPAVVEAGRASVAIALRRVWMLGCENTLKETLWRVTLNGVPGAGGGGIIFTAPCPCGWHPTHGPRPDLMWRSHYFWECRVATAVVGAVRAGLEAKGVLAGALACRHVWLLQPPDAAVYAD